jgi:SAM-dependent methyltransferase
LSLVPAEQHQPTVTTGDKQRPQTVIADAFSVAQAIAFAPLLFQAARALRDLGMLSAVESAPSTAEETARRCGTTPYGAQVLLEAGVALGVLETRSYGVYGLTPVGHLLLHDEMTRINMDFVADICYGGAARLSDAIRTGKPEGLSYFGEWKTIYEALRHLPNQARQSWLRFDHFYSEAAFPEAVEIVLERKPRRLLDVGGNTGRWALRCTQKDPNIEVTILDLPTQVEDALRNAAAAGVQGRVRGVGIDLLDSRRDFPGGFDAVWMSQFLDCFSDADATDLLRRGRRAVAPQGRLYVLEPLRDRQRNAVGEFCLRAASLYFTCMANGDSRFFDSTELRHLIDAAGLVIERTVEGLGTGHTLFVCRPG